MFDSEKSLSEQNSDKNSDKNSEKLDNMSHADSEFFVQSVQEVQTTGQESALVKQSTEEDSLKLQTENSVKSKSMTKVSLSKEDSVAVTKVDQRHP